MTLKLTINNLNWKKILKFMEDETQIVQQHNRNLVFSNENGRKLSIIVIHIHLFYIRIIRVMNTKLSVKFINVLVRFEEPPEDILG